MGTLPWAPAFAGATDIIVPTIRFPIPPKPTLDGDRARMIRSNGLEGEREHGGNGDLEFSAARASRARWVWRHRRGHVDPDRQRRPPHPVARARERAEELHRR